MPIRLNDLARKERKFVMQYEGEEAEIVYHPSGYTPLVEDTLQGSIEGGRPSTGLAQVLSQLLVGWDVIGDNGQPLPTDYDTLKGMSTDFLTSVMNGITDDQRVRREDRKNSGGGSFRAEK